jgi:hypothetical protein
VEPLPLMARASRIDDAADERIRLRRMLQHALQELEGLRRLLP